MEGFQAFLQNVGSMISNAFSSIGNFFSGMGGSSDSSGSGSSVSNLAASATLAAGVAMTPTAAAAEPVAQPVAQPAQQTYFMPNAPAPNAYPSSSPTNMHNTNAVQNQVLNAMGGLVNQTLGRMGTAGQIIGPAVRAPINAAREDLRSQQTINAACNIPAHGIGATPDVRAAFNASCQDRQERLNEARVAGTEAMIQRGKNQSITIGATKAIEALHKPQISVLGDIFKR